MTNKLDKAVFLAELDALLDTRATILTRELGVENIPRFLKAGYFERFADRFDQMPWRTFREHYRTRDKSVLAGAMATPVVRMISEYVRSVIQNVVSSPNHLEPAVIVNVYPYDLSETERQVIAEMISVKTGGFCEVGIISKDYASITPRWLKANDVSYYALYDYTEWLNIHFDNKNLVDTKCTDIGLIAPRIIVSDPANVYLPDLEKDFQITEDRVAPYISLSYSPVSDFCVDLPGQLLEKMFGP